MQYLKSTKTPHGVHLFVRYWLLVLLLSPWHILKFCGKGQRVQKRFDDHDIIILFGYYYTSFIKALSLTLFRALISNSIRLDWSMTEYLKFWDGSSGTFLAASNFLPVR